MLTGLQNKANEKPQEMAKYLELPTDFKVHLISSEEDLPKMKEISGSPIIGLMSVQYLNF